MNYLELVQEFHKLFDQPILEEAAFPEKDRQTLRLDLIREEFQELEAAVRQGDFKEVIDALCDLQYVLSGTVLEFGLKDKFAEFFEETHRSNMSKACATENEAFATVDWYKSEKGIKAHYIQKEGRYLVIRTDNGKVLKSIRYSPVNYQL